MSTLVKKHTLHHLRPEYPLEDAIGLREDLLQLIRPRNPQSSF